MFLLDTNVASDAYKGVREPRAWLETIDPMTVFLSVITIGEIERGIAIARRKSPHKVAAITDWLKGLRRDNADRILDVTEAIALRWGAISAGKSRGDADGLIAATAFVHGFTLVTRNVADFADTGVPLLNPWSV